MPTDLTKLPRRNLVQPTEGRSQSSPSDTRPQLGPKVKATTARASVVPTKGRVGLKADIK
jgi:hypothetical protein